MHLLRTQAEPWSAPDDTFRMVVEASPSAMVMVDRQGLIVLVNAAARRMFGYEYQEMLGAPVEMLMPERYRDGHRGLRVGFQTNSPVSRPMGSGRDLFAKRKDGSEFPVEIGINPIPMGDQTMVLSSIIDVSDRAERLRQANEALTARTHELETVNRELEAFAYSVSHDLRAPLRSMDGFSQALMQDYADTLDDTAKDYLARIRRGAVRMGQLIDDLLKLSRVTRSGLSPVPVDLSELATAVINDLQMADPLRRVRVEIEPELRDVADPRLMMVVLTNLIGNAWKFTRPKADAHIRFGREQWDGKLQYCVADNGVGFDMRYVAKLFTPFQRLHGAGEFEGTGIGLVTVERVIRRHAGQVTIQSALGQGTRVYFTLAAKEHSDA